MFEAFRCENCIYGRYHLIDNSWGCLIDIIDEEECENNYEDSERI